MAGRNRPEEERNGPDGRNARPWRRNLLKVDDTWLAILLRVCRGCIHTHGKVMIAGYVIDRDRKTDFVHANQVWRRTRGDRTHAAVIDGDNDVGG